MNKHIHKYVRIKIGRNKRIEYRCAIPGCVHHIRPELVVGRYSICNKCGAQFTMSKLSTKLAKPHCMNCGLDSDVKKLAELFEVVE